VNGLPNNITDAHEEITSLRGKVDSLRRLANQLEEALRLARANRFGNSSEKLDDNQASLFDEAELEALVDGDENNETTGNVVSISGHTRNRGLRKPLPANLPRVRVEHTLDASELVTPDGKVFVKIGESTSEQLAVIPASVYVIQHVRFKYAVPNFGEHGVKIAPINNQTIPKSMASASLLAHIAQSKYDYHLPLYRQERYWHSLGIDINRTSMARWLVELGSLISPLTELILKTIKKHPVINVDETRVTVVNDKHKKPDKASHGGWMWAYTNAKGIFYEYTHSRQGLHAVNRLRDFTGHVQKDGFSGYDQLFDPKKYQSNLIDQYPKIQVGCMAHARRKFMDVIKATKLTKANATDEASIISKLSLSNSQAAFFIKEFAKLYKVEKDLKKDGYSTDNLEDEFHIHETRQAQSKPILDNIKVRMDNLDGQALPKSTLGMALTYLRNNWASLIEYINCGLIEIDNNRAERAIKPFVIGRKNWLFSQATKGAEASANLLTLIENAKHHDLNVLNYLQYVFENIRSALSLKDPEALVVLLPSEVAKANILDKHNTNQFKKSA